MIAVLLMLCGETVDLPIPGEPVKETTAFTSYSDVKWEILKDDQVSLGFIFLHDGTTESRAVVDRTVETWESQGFDFTEHPWAITGLDDFTTSREHSWRKQIKPLPIVVMLKRDQQAACTYGPCSLELPATPEEFEAWKLRTCKTAANRPSGTRAERQEFAERCIGNT